MITFSIPAYDIWHCGSYHVIFCRMEWQKCDTEWRIFLLNTVNRQLPGHLCQVMTLTSKVGSHFSCRPKEFFKFFVLKTLFMFCAEWHTLLLRMIPESLKLSKINEQSTNFAAVSGGHQGSSQGPHGLSHDYQFVMWSKMAFNFCYTEWHLMRSMFWDKSISHIATCFWNNVIKSPVFPNLGVWPPLKVHKMNLGICEMINGRGKKKNLSFAAQVCIHILVFSLIFAILWNIGQTDLFGQLFKLNHLKSLDGKYDLLSLLGTDKRVFYQTIWKLSIFLQNFTNKVIGRALRILCLNRWMCFSK